jgi:lysophospholipase L1-like esterase
MDLRREGRFLNLGTMSLSSAFRFLLWCITLSVVSCAAVEVDSLAGLLDQASRSGVSVKLKPGIYRLDDPAIARAAVVPHPEGSGAYRVNTLLHFSGDDSHYDLRDVVLEIDTRLHRAVPGPLDKVLVSGRRNTLAGLTIRDLGDTAPGRGGLRMLHVIGDGNTLENFTLNARGSAPYGYGNLLGKGSKALVPLQKQSCFLITGRDTRVRGTRVIARVFGHGIVMQGAVNTLIENCYVEGEMRLTDDILKETSGPAHSIGFRSDYPPGRIVPGLMIALSEDGVRAYPDGSQVGERRTEKITVINTIVQNMRSGFDLSAASGEVLVSGCTSLGCNEKGFNVPSRGVIEKSSGDARYGPLLSLHGKNDRDSRVELTLLPSTSDHPPTRIAEINGTGHTITIRMRDDGKPVRALPIIFGESFWADVHHFRSPTQPRETWTGAVNITLRNETTLPVVLGSTARENWIISRGPVSRDEGKENKLEPLAALPAALQARVISFGDSITRRGYPAELGQLLGVPVANAGVGGNSSAAGLKRLDADVIAAKPEIVVILFGTNDTRLDAPKVHVPIERYVANLREMVARCTAAGARVVLCTVPPIAEDAYFKRHERAAFVAAGGLTAVLESYRAAVVMLGAELGLPVVDLSKALATRPEWLSPDGVHPAPAGNALIAQLVAEKVRPMLTAHSRP